MRHWLWYKTSGEIGGEALIGGGWDNSFDFNDSGTLDPTALNSYNYLSSLPGFSGFIAYDCVCDPVIVWCQHATEQVANCRVAGDTLEEKPDYVLLVDGVTIDSLTITDKTPATTVTLQLSGALPDDTIIEAINLGNTHLLQTSPTLLTFSGGVTNTINLVTPSQGIVGKIGVLPPNREAAKIKQVNLRGWTS